VRLFSVTVRTTFSGAPAADLGFDFQSDLDRRTDEPARCAMTSSAMRPASRPARLASADGSAR
jgi:hypothetical protein